MYIVRKSAMFSNLETVFHVFGCFLVSTAVGASVGVVSAPVDGRGWVLNEHVANSRHKRSHEHVDVKYVVYEGMDPSRNVPLNGTYADGKSCVTGQDPFNETEAELAKRGVKRILEIANSPYDQLLAKDYLNEYTKSIDSQKILNNCKTKICNFDQVKMSWICGPLPPRNFSNGKSCIDGSEPLSEAAFKKAAGSKTDNFLNNRDEPTIEAVNAENIKAQGLYGKNCKSGKCYYHFNPGSYICGCCTNKPILEIIVLLATVFFCSF